MSELKNVPNFFNDIVLAGQMMIIIWIIILIMRIIVKAGQMVGFLSSWSPPPLISSEQIVRMMTTINKLIN